MDPLNTNKSSYEQIRADLEIYRIRNTSYSFNALRKVVEMHGWTLKEYNEAREQELVVKKLKGHD